jgi:hypothetical protein
MRTAFPKTLVAFFLVLALACTLTAQNRGGQAPPAAQGGRGGRGVGGASATTANPNYVANGVPRMPNPPGPAPKRDLTGAWIGPLNTMRETIPPMTPAGEARFKLNKPQSVVSLAATNDPFVTCDPLGLTRGIIAHPFQNRQGLWFEPVPNRMVILQQYQRTWRDIWMDGRSLPAKVDARGYPDARYYGYSVGHWEDDYTFVIDSTGVNDTAWLDEDGHPHSADAHFQERYTRMDEYNIHFTMTVDDPKYYTKPFELINGTYYRMAQQDFEEAFCVPSDAISYRDDLAKPAGTGNEGR